MGHLYHWTIASLKLVKVKVPELDVLPTCLVLVLSNMIFIFYIWDVILPIDEVIFFKMVKLHHQAVIYIYHLNHLFFNGKTHYFYGHFPVRSVKVLADNPSHWLSYFSRWGNCTTQWIGLRENLQENPIFNGKIYGFL